MDTPYQILHAAFSEDGYTNSHFVLKLDKDVSISIKPSDEGHYLLSFQDNLPKVRLLRIPVAVAVKGILFKEDGGTLMLNYFPDIPFKYEWLIPDVSK